MRKFLKKKAVAVAIVGLVTVGASMAAYAYWTAGGSGDGEADTGTFLAVTAVQTSVISDMHPGDVAQTLSGTFLNPNAGPVYVSTVTASIASVTKDPGAVAGTCDATDYTLANAVMTKNAEVLADDTSTWSGATIKFNNKATNQDQCKNATVNLAYVIA